jgi:hypothetical protein
MFTVNKLAFSCSILTQSKAPQTYSGKPYAGDSEVSTTHIVQGRKNFKGNRMESDSERRKRAI